MASGSRGLVLSFLGFSLSTWANDMPSNWKMIFHYHMLFRSNNHLFIPASPSSLLPGNSFRAPTMVRRSPEHYIDDDFFFSSSGSSTGSVTSRGKRLTAGLFNSVSALVASCSKQASRVSRKLRSKQNQSRIEPKSPLARPKQLLTNISNKKIPFLQKKKGGEEREGGEGAEKGFGEGGVWQRAILMGDKCEPLDYSGAIYYNSKGEQVQDIPMRSPRASPLPRYAAGR